METPPEGGRISLRWLDGNGVAHDLLGEVIRARPDTLLVLPWDRGPVEVAVPAVLAWRPVPAKTVRPSSTPADVARLAARGWPGLEVERLGGWELRASGGYTRRANSALCEGDPGVDLPAAIRRLAAFYRARDLPPQVMLAARPGERHPLKQSLIREGWRAHTPTWLMTVDLRAARPDPRPTGLHLTWSDRPDADWLGAFGRPHPLRSAVLTAAPAGYLSVHAGEELVAIARLAITADWAGISGLWVAPDRRGQGIGGAAMGALTGQALAGGARFGYLQVTADNGRARSLYERLGWQVHHHYSYLTLD